MTGWLTLNLVVEARNDDTSNFAFFTVRTRLTSLLNADRTRVHGVSAHFAFSCARREHSVANAAG